jgi:transcriptional regulator with PAS, ATPase and Fis domain
MESGPGLNAIVSQRERFFLPECPPAIPLAGRSPAMAETLRTIRLVAESQCNPVLILGETGTGKELAAEAVHTLRGGTRETFIAVNCATLTANLLESELFGHVKGAFTGADHEKTGLFEVAGSGSIFLDEISEMPIPLQAKLLRVLQERSFRKVGGTRDIPCRATVLASSNRDLAAESREGRFRRDLYYRLAVFPIHLAPLRSPDRREDVPLLAEYFIGTSSVVGRTRARGLTEESRQRLLAHAWPGNVRELRNVIDRAMLLETSSQVAPASLRIDHEPATTAPPAGMPIGAADLSLETAERLFIARALEETGWQRTRAAALLGITRATLHAKLKRYKISIPHEDGLSDPALPASRALSRLGAAVM